MATVLDGSGADWCGANRVPQSPAVLVPATNTYSHAIFTLPASKVSDPPTVVMKIESNTPASVLTPLVHQLLAADDKATDPSHTQIFPVLNLVSVTAPW